MPETNETWSQETEKMAQEVAERAMRGPRCRNALGGVMGTHCCDEEKQRRLTAEEKARGWTCRPFVGYNPINMCRPCAAYWHASCAALLIAEERRADLIATREK